MTNIFIKFFQIIKRTNKIKKETNVCSNKQFTVNIFYFKAIAKNIVFEYDNTVFIIHELLYI